MYTIFIINMIINTFNICLKKKFVQRASAAKNIPAQAGSEKKKFVQAENSPPPPHHFSNDPSLSKITIGGTRLRKKYKFALKLIC